MVRSLDPEGSLNLIRRRGRTLLAAIIDKSFTLTRVEYVFLGALLLAVVVFAEEEDKRAALPAMSNRVIAQFLERLPAYKAQQQRRFDLSFQEPPVASGRGFDFELRKRNNAEVVNHILKNFGQLDRLGDVGK